jgi:hypothetical protein
MKVGDLIANKIILEVWDFKKYCDAHDDLELEYDVDEAWENWQKHGPYLTVLDPDQTIVIGWGFEHATR